MRFIALFLGVLGSGVGVIAALVAMTVGGISAIFSISDVTFLGGLGAGGLSFVAFVAAVLTIGKPKVGALIMLAVAVGGVMLISMLYMPAAVLLVLAALFAFASNDHSAHLRYR